MYFKYQFLFVFKYHPFPKPTDAPSKATIYKVRDYARELALIARNILHDRLARQNVDSPGTASETDDTTTGNDTDVQTAGDETATDVQTAGEETAGEETATDDHSSDVDDNPSPVYYASPGGSGSESESSTGTGSASGAAGGSESPVLAADAIIVDPTGMTFRVNKRKLFNKIIYNLFNVFIFYLSIGNVGCVRGRDESSCGRYSSTFVV